MSEQLQSKRFDLPSGAILVVTVADFVDAWGLMRASLKTLKGMDVKPEELKQDMSALAANPSAFALILDRIVEFATSPEVESAVWKCAVRALYIPTGSPVEFPGVHVNSKMFDDIKFGHQAREDFVKIVTAIVEVNCKPFLAAALSGFRKQTPTAVSPEGLKSA